MFYNETETIREKDWDK